jgi:predicted O-methyltransferase YrrM
VRDWMNLARAATARARARTIVDRERTIREREEEIRRLNATVAALRSGAVVPGGVESRAEPRALAEASEDVAAPVSLPAGLADRIRDALPNIEGWCTERKALWLADLITSNRCLAVLEIGIYGGRSLIPMAMAVQALGAGGKVHGVEAWSNSVAVATETNAENDAWWQTVDLKAIRKGFFRNVARYEVADTVVVMEMSSDEAFAAISGRGLGPFDLVHVDGSHSEVQALRDVEMWSGLVRPGGILVLDDIGWSSVRAAREHVRRNFSDIAEIAESETIAYGAYRRGPAPDARSARP